MTMNISTQKGESPNFENIINNCWEEKLKCHIYVLDNNIRSKSN